MSITRPFDPHSSHKDFIVMDARGHHCPVPALKLRRQFERFPDTRGVILWANDPMAQVDIPHFCNENKFVLISSHKEDADFVFIIARA
ncbi:MAG: sulfurtransferase TusA family protein [Asticcacaulis sp.]